MNRPGIRRLVRIAFSVVCGITCVLLIAFWPRSYWARDVVYGWFPFPGYLQVDSSCGDVKVIANGELQEPQWKFESAGPEVFKRHWYFDIDENSRFGWWVDITVPHWFLLVLSSALAVAPWVHWSRRFSLRTLLIATTLIAAVLGLIAVSSR